MKKLIYFIKQRLKLALKNFNFRLVRNNSNLIQRKKKKNINVGCGNYEIDGFISVDYYSKAYYESSNFDRINYDLTNDLLPFENNSLGSIYCSHVIEHVRKEHVIKFINDSYRCLEKGGVLRIVCPDSEYLYYQLLNHKEYFSWHKLYKTENDAALCFVNLMADDKALLDGFGLNKNIFNYEYHELTDELERGLKFNKKNPSRHISNWDFKKVYELGKSVGFKCIEKSQFQGSFYPALRGNDID